jgi:hypothetical protein
LRQRCGTLFSRLSTTAQANSTTASSVPAINSVGCSSFRPTSQGVCCQKMSCARYQLSPPRKPVRVNSLVK